MDAPRALAKGRGRNDFERGRVDDGEIAGFLVGDVDAVARFWVGFDRGTVLGFTWTAGCRGLYFQLPGGAIGAVEVLSCVLLKGRVAFVVPVEAHACAQGDVAQYAGCG